MTNEPPPDLVDALRALGLRAARDSLAALIAHATKTRMGATETLESLVTVERRARDATNLARRTTAAALGALKPRDRFDWAHPRKIDRPLIENLFQLDFVEHGDNVLLRGPSGVGKTLLAKLLGSAALERGYSVRSTDFNVSTATSGGQFTLTGT